jgi:hypothetical protein
MVQAIQIERWVSTETVVHPWMGPAYFNSSFSTHGISATQNAKLTIHLRVWLEEQTPKSPRNKYVNWPNVWNNFNHSWVPWLVPWAPGTFDSFKYSFKKDLEDFWGNAGFCLMPIHWEGLDVPLGIRPTHRVNVDCGFEIVWANGREDAHVRIYCVDLIPPSRRGSTPFMCFLLPGTADETGDGLMAREFANTTGLCGNPAAKVPKGISPIQVCYGLGHEIGHGLGMPHIGVSLGSHQCMEDSLGSNFIERAITQLGLRHPDKDDMNADSCYYGDSDEDAQNIMGWGRKITAVNGLPWLLRLTQHTHTSPDNWKITMGQQSPTPLPLSANAGSN